MKSLPETRVATNISLSLAFMLVDLGFDVWMPNARGNMYSQRHVNMTYQDPEFWKFSWEEMALQDLPVIMDHIRNQTGQEKLSYVGVSMGTTVFFAAMAAKPELNSRIKVMVALAPAGNLNNTSSPFLRFLSRNAKEIEAS